MKECIFTEDAPKAIGPYSQAIKVNNIVFCSGQIPLHPSTMQLVSEDIAEQAHQVFLNLKAVCQKAGGQLSDIVKLTIFLTNLADFPTVNDVMTSHFQEPYPARSTIEVSALPKGAQVEIEAMLVLL